MLGILAIAGVVGGLCGLYALSWLAAKKPDSRFGTLGTVLLAICLLTLMLITLNFFWEGMTSLRYRNPTLFLVTLLAIAFSICSWIHLQIAAEERKRDRLTEQAAVAAWAQRVAKLDPATESEVLQRLYDEGINLRERLGIYGNEKFDQTLKVLSGLMASRVTPN